MKCVLLLVILIGIGFLAGTGALVLDTEDEGVVKQALARLNTCTKNLVKAALTDLETLPTGGRSPKPKPKPKPQPVYEYNTFNEGKVAVVDDVDVLGGLLSQLLSHSQVKSDYSELHNVNRYGRSASSSAYQAYPVTYQPVFTSHAPNFLANYFHPSNSYGFNPQYLG